MSETYCADCDEEFGKAAPPHAELTGHKLVTSPPPGASAGREEPAVADAGAVILANAYYRLRDENESLRSALAAERAAGERLRASLREIAEYKQVPIEGDHFSFAHTKRLAARALAADRETEE